MNWKAINETYPQAFLEWVNGSLGNGKATAIKCIQEEFYAEYSSTLVAITATWLDGRLLQLPHYFDTLGISVDTTTYEQGESTLFKLVVSTKKDIVLFKKGYKTRLEALEAGIIKAFEIREEQLKMIEG